MIHFDKSIEILHSLKIDEPKTKTVYLMDACGYVSAEDIVADHNSPDVPTSAMDGYAVLYEDMSLERLCIIGTNPAGMVPQIEVIGGTCVKTFTGSLMPHGADTLIPIENVEVQEDEIVIKEPVEKGYAVRKVGEIYAKGELLIATGTVIEFPQIGVLASLNISEIQVYEKPKVAILSTGSELLALGEEQTSYAQIRSSNNYVLEAIVQKYGGEALQLGCIRDDKETIKREIDKALMQSDIVVATGGVSVGDFDFVKDVIYELGYDVVFKGVRVKPGQHIMVARKGDKFIIGLPGFAYSATVTALLYLVPIMEKLQYRPSAMRIVKATVKEAFHKRAKKAEFTACNISLVRGKYYVDFKGKKVGTSAILTNMLGSAALLVTSEEEGSKDAGDEVNVLLWD